MLRFRHRFFLHTWAWLLCILGLSCQWAGAQELAAPAQPHVLTLGVFAYRPDNVVKARFDALGNYLTTQLQGQVVKVVPMGDDELEQAVQQHRVDFVLTNPAHYVRLREHSRLSGALATLVTRQGNHGVHGIGGVVVRLADRTDLKQLSDLADKRIAIASQQALGTYMAPAIELMRANVDLNNINWLQTTQPVDQVIYAVLNRQADAGFVRTGVLEAMERDGLLRPGALTVINPVSHPGFEYRTSTRLYPEWPFLVVAGVDPAISQRVSAALMALRPDDPAALAAGVYGFTIPADYAPVEQAMRELRMAPYDATPKLDWHDVWQRYQLWLLGLCALTLMAVLLTLGLLVHRKRLLQTQSHLKAERKQLREATQRLNYLMESSPVMFYTVQVNGPKARTSWVSNNVEQLLGYTATQVMDSRWWRQHLHPDDAELAIANIRRLHLTKAVHHQFRFAHADGSYRWFDNEVHLLDSPAEDMEALGVWRDITESKQQEDELQLAASVFDNSYDGIIITDAQHRIVDVNPAFIRITGLSENQVHDLPLTALAMHNEPTEYQVEPASEWVHEMPLALATQGHWQGEVVLRCHNGQPMACALSASVVHGAHQGPTTGHHVVVFSDISHIKAHQAELDRLAHYDPLTGVPNRRMLVDRLAQAVERSRRSGKTLAVCYLDLDDFKPVNDRLGHAMGDQLLISMTHRLQGILRAQDTLARLGGDEFVLLLADMNPPNEWEIVLQRVLDAVQQPVTLGVESATVSASVGVTVYPDDDVDADTLLRHADQAMYRAKQSGRNRMHLFDMAQDKEVQVQREQQIRLAQAIERSELVLHYQPKVDLESGDVVGVEALVRWQHPEQGLLPPSAFLWHITGSELEVALGEWVIQTALAQLNQWKTQPPGLPADFCVSVNLSGYQLLKPGFQAWLQATLQRHPGTQSDELELEILESAAIADMATAARVMTDCRALGVRFALDDFGTGYSSLAYFRTLPVDLIKIDQSFVRDMLHDADDHGIVQSVVYLAHAFHRPVIAEGVETLAHAAALLRLGCHLAQGYGIARPMPADQLQPWIAQWQQQRVWETIRQTLQA